MYEQNVQTMLLHRLNKRDQRRRPRRWRYAPPFAGTTTCSTAMASLRPFHWHVVKCSATTYLLYITPNTTGVQVTAARFCPALAPRRGPQARSLEIPGALSCGGGVGSALLHDATTSFQAKRFGFQRGDPKPDISPIFRTFRPASANPSYIPNPYYIILRQFLAGSLVW
jgi:hypothetical protein